MSAFGIEDYSPNWGNGLAAAMRHASRMHALVGRQLTSAWLVWDLNDDEWFADCPVLLDFAGERIEVNHYKFDDLSITWNSVDPTREITPSTWDNFHLVWRNDARSDLAALHGQTVQVVEFIEWTGAGNDVANGMIAVGFGFETGYVCVFNALDENGLEIGPLDPRWGRHPLVT